MRIIHVVECSSELHENRTTFYGALRCFPQVRQVLVHTGQHYDLNMSGALFQRAWHASNGKLIFGSGPGSTAQQTAAIMAGIECVMVKNKPDMVLVYGDVNSTVAAALVCAKMLIPFTHVEAGLRSFDRAMPEEINRILTDQLSDLLLTPSIDANQNLLRENVPEHKIKLVGSVMIDTLVRLLPTATAVGTPPAGMEARFSSGFLRLSQCLGRGWAPSNAPHAGIGKDFRPQRHARVRCRWFV